VSGVCGQLQEKSNLTSLKVEIGKSGRNSGVQKLCRQTEVAMADAAGICVVPYKTQHCT